MKNNKFIFVFFLSLFFILCSISCKKGGPFAPKADARVKSLSSTEIVVTAANQSTTATIEVINGVDVTFEKYFLDYYDTGGNQLPLSTSHNITLTISGSGSTIPSIPPTGTLTIYPVPQDVINYANTNNIKRITVNVKISGGDVNGNSIDLYTSLTLNF